jgi:putative AlgH/UPF0301 family transcriptional regulator
MPPRKLCFTILASNLLVSLLVWPPFAQSGSSYLPVQTKNIKALGAGKVLVASRQLGDPHFVKTVILLVHYDAQGVVGLILNKRTEVPISQALDNMKEAKNRSDHVYVGGPVEMPAVFGLLQSRDKVEGAEHVFGEVYLITTKNLFEQALSTRPNPDQFHVYVGYAGWSNEQLKKEVEAGAWFIFPGDAGTIFNSSPESLWPKMIGKTELEMAGKNPTNRNAGPYQSLILASR